MDPAWNPQARMQHYRTLKAKHRRNQNDLIVESVLQRMHRSKDIFHELGHQLTAEETDKIVSDWMTRGRPVRPQQLMQIAPTWNIPWWDVCLRGTPATQANEDATVYKPTGPTLREIMAQKCKGSL
jgi:hypothetical protein